MRLRSCKVQATEKGAAVSPVRPMPSTESDSWAYATQLARYNCAFVSVNLRSSPHGPKEILTSHYPRVLQTARDCCSEIHFRLIIAADRKDNCIFIYADSTHVLPQFPTT